MIFVVGSLDRLLPPHNLDFRQAVVFTTTLSSFTLLVSLPSFMPLNFLLASQTLLIRSLPPF